MSFDAHAPEPFTPADLDLRNCRWMPLDVQALLLSDFFLTSSDAGFRAGVTLWMNAWHSVPAASLPDDDVALAQLAGFGRDVAGFKAIRREAMRGFVRCNDGRWYHPVISQKALEAADQLKAGEKRRQAWKEKKASQRAASAAKKPQKENEQGTVPGDISETSPGSPPFDHTTPHHTTPTETMSPTEGGSGGNPNAPPSGARPQSDDPPELKLEPEKPTEPRPRRRSPARPLPKDWREKPESILTETNLAAAIAGGMTEEIARYETHQFVQHAISKDRREREWNAAWRGWIGSGYWSDRPVHRNRGVSRQAAPAQNGSGGGSAAALARFIARRQDPQSVPDGAERREFADAFSSDSGNVLDLKAVGRDRFG